MKIAALYRANAADDWADVEIVSRHRSGALVLREVGKKFPGVWLARSHEVRVAGHVLRYRQNGPREA